MGESKEIKTDLEKQKKVDAIKEWENFSVGFANNLAGAYSIGAYINRINQMASSGSYNPPTAEDYTQTINISPSTQDTTTIKKYLANPAKHQKELRDISQYLENTIMQYKRTTDYIAKILTFNNDMRSITLPKNSEEIKTWKTGRERCLNFLQKFNQKYQAGMVMSKIATEGGFFAWLEENDEFATLIEIPSDWCYITGRWDYGWTYAIDLAYYDQFVGLCNVTPELIAYYEEFVKQREAGLRGAKLAPYQYYLVPVHKGYVFTFNVLRPQIVPPMTGVFLDASAILEYKNLLKSKMALDTIALIAQEIPKDDEGQPAMDAITAQRLVSTVISVLPKQVSTFATPFKAEKMEFNGSQNQNNWTGFGENQYWRTSGVGSSIMDMTDSNAVAQKFSMLNDHGMVEHIYRQFENFINIQLYLKSKQFRFVVRFYGNRYTDREDVKDYSALVTSNNMPVGKLYGMLGYEPYEIDGVIEMEELLGWRTKVTSIVPASQQSSKGGRPQKDLSDMAEGGVKQVDYDSNSSKG